MVWVSFGLVNIMQPQNCTTRLRRLVWTSFFLCVVFFISFICMIFLSRGGIDWERSAFFFSVAFKYNKLCVKCTFGWWFASFHFEVCADLPPGRHTMILYCDMIQLVAYVQSFKSDIWTHVLWGWGSKTCGHDIIGPRLHRIGALKRDYRFSSYCLAHTMWVNALCRCNSTWLLCH